MMLPDQEKLSKISTLEREYADLHPRVIQGKGSQEDEDRFSRLGGELLVNFIVNSGGDKEKSW